MADPFGKAIPVRLSERAANDDPHRIEGIDVAGDRSPNGEEGALKNLVSGGIPRRGRLRDRLRADRLA